MQGSTLRSNTTQQTQPFFQRTLKYSTVQPRVFILGIEPNEIEQLKQYLVAAVLYSSWEDEAGITGFIFQMPVWHRNLLIWLVCIYHVDSMVKLIYFNYAACFN